MEFKGGGIGGMGTLQLTGTLNVGGTSSTDEPTLGIALNLGDGTTTTTMEYNSNTVPLVLRDNGNITVEANATLDFSGAASGTAIAAGDGSSHTLTIDGGTVQTNGTAEEDVAMGVVENSGTMTINGPFVLTGFNADSFGLDVTGGTTELRKDASFSGGANVYNGGWLIIDQNVNASFGGSMVVSGGGTVSTSGNLTCTGQVTVKGGMAGNGKLNLSGSLDAQGGVILMDKGIITTQSSTGATISMGSSSVFQMQGGILYVTPQTSGNGTLTVYGSMSISGGDVWINCDSTHNTSGFLYVTGVLTLTNGNTATLHCKDVDYNNVGMNYGAIYCDADGGGNFAVGDLPPTGGGGWFDNNRSFRAWS